MPEHMQGRIVPVYKGIPGNVSGVSIEQLINWAVSTNQSEAIGSAIDQILQTCQMNEYDILDICDNPNGDKMNLANYFDYEIGLQDLLAALHVPNSIEMGTKALEVGSRVFALGIPVQAQKANGRED